VERFNGDSARDATMVTIQMFPAWTSVSRVRKGVHLSKEQHRVINASVTLDGMVSQVGVSRVPNTAILSIDRVTA
jgi:hypothetical protein